MPKNNALAGGYSTALRRNVENGLSRAILRAGFYLLAGFLSSRAQIFSKCAPFGIAAVAASKTGDGLFVLFGAMLGYLLPGGPDYALRYIAAAAAVFLLRWVLSGFEELTAKPAFAPVLAAGAAGITGAAVVVAGGFLPYDVLIYLTETLLCACGTYFFGLALSYITKPAGLWGLSQHELISVTISLCVMLLSLERLQFSGISLGRIAAVLIVLCAAKYGRESGGAVMGICAGMVLGLGGGPMSVIFPGCAFGGLFAGIFSRLGRVFCAAAFVLADIVAAVTLSASLTQALAMGYEVLIASVIFLVIPEKLLCRSSALFAPLHGRGEQKVAREINERLCGAAETLDEIASMVSSVHTKLARIGSDDISRVIDGVSESVCKKCGMHLYCWGTVYNDTMNAFDDLTGTLKKNKTVSRDDIPKHFAARCCKLTDLVGTVNRCFAEYTARKAAELKTEQLRRMMAPSFSNTACLMRDIAADFSQGKKQTAGSERVRAALAACGLSAVSSRLFVDRHGRLTVEAEIDGSVTRLSRGRLLEALRTTCGRSMEGPRILEDETGAATTLSFSQKPRYSVRFGEATLQKDGESLCGDACASYVDEQGRAILMLSDGMGCGGAAAVDSNLTVGLMSRLLRCGFGFDEAAKITGSAMMVKSGDESFSTLDIACIDLYDGSATFLKAGAPPAYVRRCGRVERIEPSSMPIGILQEAKLEKVSVRLRSGDVVLVASDGVTAQDDAYLISALQRFDGEPRAFARKLAGLAKENRKDGHDDDVTVMVAVLS